MSKMFYLKSLLFLFLTTTSAVSAFSRIGHHEQELQRREPYANIDYSQQGLRQRDAYPEIFYTEQGIYQRDAYPQPFYVKPDFYQRDAYPEASFQEYDIYKQDVYEQHPYSGTKFSALANLLERDLYAQDLIHFPYHVKRAPDLDIYVGIGNRRSPKEALHWMLLVAPVGSDRCTYYHVTGGPTHGTSFKLEIQANKRIDSNGIDQKVKLGAVPASELNKIKAAAQGAALPATPKNCQNWLVDVLGKLEKKGLVPQGTAAHWQSRVEVVKAPSPSPEPTAAAVGRSGSKSPSGGKSHQG